MFIIPLPIVYKVVVTVGGTAIIIIYFRLIDRENRRWPVSES